MQSKIYDRFAAKFIETMSSIKVGNGLEKATQMGPLAHARRVDVMQAFVEDARSHGGEIVIGGARLKSPGNFFSPTVITGLPDHAKLMTEEPFGPIAPLTPFTDPEDAIRRANSLPYGLSSYVFTESLKTATYAANAIEAGHGQHQPLRHARSPRRRSAASRKAASAARAGRRRSTATSSRSS